MSTSVSWPPIGGNSYSIPATGELNWQALSSFLVAIGNKAQSIDNTKLAIRIATTTPVTLATASDCVVVTNLGTPGAVAVTLPAGITGQTYFLVDGKGDAATNNITVTPNGAELINGGATYVINKNRAGIVFSYNGVGWSILAEYTNIAAGTIPRSSIAAGTPNQVVINNGSGNLSSEAALAKSRGGTGADNSSVTFPSTGVVVTEAGSETLTNKTIDGDDNTVQDLPVTALKTVIGQASTFLSFNGSGAPIATKVVPAGTVVGTSDVQALTLKDIDGGTASNSTRITVPANTTTNLNALTRKAGTVVWDTTTTQLKYDNGSALQVVAANVLATPTAAGTVTSYFPTVASAVNVVSSANYTILTADGYSTILVSTGSTTRTVTLPAAASNTGRIVTIGKTDTGTGFVTVAGTIDGATNKSLFMQTEAITVISNGTNWNTLDYKQNNQSQTYTPTFAGLGTMTAVNFNWQRCGNMMRVWGLATSGTVNGSLATMTLPSPYTIDVSNQNSNIVIGNWWNSIVSGVKTGTAIVPTSASANLVYFGFSDFNSSNPSFTALTGAQLMSSTNSLMIDVSVLIPIAEWAQS